MKETYYTVEQISEMLHMHVKTVQRYIREGKLRAVKIGKSWRVSGHDLSVFTEGTKLPAKSEAVSERRITASSVIDIDVLSRNEAIRIVNALTASMNSKPPEYGPSSMQAQFIEPEFKVRITLWGSVKFMAVILSAVETLTQQDEEESL
jgi:excisionase family DNA binding protein